MGKKKYSYSSITLRLYNSNNSFLKRRDQPDTHTTDLIRILGIGAIYMVSGTRDNPLTALPWVSYLFTVSLKNSNNRLYECPRVVLGVSGRVVSLRQRVTFPYCKKIYIEETGRRPGDRFREHLRDVEWNDKDASKPVARHCILPNHSKKHMEICGLSLHLGSSERRKPLAQKFIFQIGTLNSTNLCSHQ